MVKIVY